jgi:hypothetical protein
MIPKLLDFLNEQREDAISHQDFPMACMYRDVRQIIAALNDADEVPDSAFILAKNLIHIGQSLLDLCTLARLTKERQKESS